MNRIMVIGVSAGVGKSTFSRRLGEALNINVYHLDTLFWKPGWVEASLEEFSRAQQDIVEKPRWIMEGNYSNTFDIRVEKADTVIYLELPLYTCLYRVLKRWLTNIGKVRPDMAEGCKEKIDWEFVKFILITYHSRKENMKKQLESYKDLGKVVVALKNQVQIDLFLKSLNPEK